MRLMTLGRLSHAVFDPIQHDSYKGVLRKISDECLPSSNVQSQSFLHHIVNQVVYQLKSNSSTSSGLTLR